MGGLAWADEAHQARESAEGISGREKGLPIETEPQWTSGIVLERSFGQNAGIEFELVADFIGSKLVEVSSLE